MHVSCTLSGTCCYIISWQLAITCFKIWTTFLLIWCLLEKELVIFMLWKNDGEFYYAWWWFWKTLGKILHTIKLFVHLVVSDSQCLKLDWLWTPLIKLCHKASFLVFITVSALSENYSQCLLLWSKLAKLGRKKSGLHVYHTFLFVLWKERSM